MKIILSIYFLHYSIYKTSDVFKLNTNNFQILCKYFKKKLYHQKSYNQAWISQQQKKTDTFTGYLEWPIFLVDSVFLKAHFCGCLLSTVSNSSSFRDDVLNFSKEILDLNLWTFEKLELSMSFCGSLYHMMCIWAQANNWSWTGKSICFPKVQKILLCCLHLF